MTVESETDRALSEVRDRSSLALDGRTALSAPVLAA